MVPGGARTWGLVCAHATEEGERMFYNSLGERVSRARFREMYNAFKNRQELMQAGLMNRRSLLKMGLLSSAGYLAVKNGLSSRAWAQFGGGGSGQCASPATTPFSIPLPIPPV